MTLGVMGGTFDPIHLGHIAAGEAAQHALSLNRIVLIPSRIPPHRLDPVTATGEQRLAMAQLAALEHPGWSASRIELDRDGPSYTYDTLVSLREPNEPALIEQGESKGTQFFFITGADAFAEIASWSRYPAVLDLANFVVVSRPGITLDSLRERVPSAFERRPAAETRVILVEANTPDVSSTDIRRRARAGESLEGFVPAPVAEYIRAHRLYLGR
ncbi:MAG TPA: nicotinate-nucleotide adenylyltransferase [Vicinamibacterales bacterium]